MCVPPPSHNHHPSSSSTSSSYIEKQIHQQAVLYEMTWMCNITLCLPSGYLLLFPHIITKSTPLLDSISIYTIPIFIKSYTNDGR